MPAYRSALLFGLVFTFCQWLVIAGLLLAVVFSFAVFVLLRKTSFLWTRKIITVFLWTPKSPLYAHHLRYALACGIGVGLPIQWLNVAIWGNGWVWWLTVNALRLLALVVCQ